MAQLTWHDVASSSSTGLYAGVRADVASITERCEPAEQPSTPMRSGSYPRFAAWERTMRTARWPSSQPLW